MDNQNPEEVIIDFTEEYCRDVIEENPKLVRLHQAGGAALGILGDLVMREAAGNCDRKKVNEVLRRLLA